MSRKDEEDLALVFLDYRKDSPLQGDDITERVVGWFWGFACGMGFTFIAVFLVWLLQP